MALFAKFKRAKDAAVEHKKSAAAQQAKPTVPYKHVPTHAAQDALAASPMNVTQTTLTPEELQSRVLAARKRRASSYQPLLTAGHSVYHSCDSSRANSIAGSSPSSAASSVKGKGHSDVSVGVLRRPQSLTHRHSTPIPSGRLQHSEVLTPFPGGPPAFLATRAQRPRPFQSSSRRSSFTKKRSPLSNVSVEEEVDQSAMDSSKSSASSGSSTSDHSQHVNNDIPIVPKFATAAKMQTVTSHTPVIENPASTQLARRRSRWSSFFPRRSLSVAAH